MRGKIKQTDINFICLLALLLLILNKGWSQRYNYINAFTTDNGLPSNHVYDMVEDDKGFLWIATNNGVSRFDGKYFQNFSVKDGLPSNDALQIVKEGNGTIWVNCYKEPPVYFDEQSKRFVAFTSNKQVNEFAKSFYKMLLTDEGFLIFYNSSGKLIFNSYKKDNCYLKKSISLVINGKQYTYTSNTVNQINNSAIYFIRISDEKHVIDSLPIYFSGNAHAIIADNKVGYYSDNSIYKIVFEQMHPLLYHTDSICFPYPVFQYRKFGAKETAIITNKKIYFIDEQKFIVLDSLDNMVIANNIFCDKNNNAWLATLDNGLKLYKPNGIGQLKIPENFIQLNFLSIATNDKGELFAGNYYGEMLHQTHHLLQKHVLSTDPRAYWLRKTVLMKNHVVVLNDYFCSIDYTRQIKLKNFKGDYSSPKSAAALNDSIIIIGTIHGLIELNINTGIYHSLNSIHDRTLSLVKGAGNVIYYIGPDGLYQYDCDRNIERRIPLNNILQKDKLAALTFSSDSTLWAATTNGNMVVVKNNKTIANVSYRIGLPNNILCMSVFKNTVWVGSQSGISVIAYSFKNGVISYRLNNISKTDGLPSNVINDFTFYKDTVYAATEKGIAKIPFYYKAFNADIVPRLTEVKVNQQRVPIANDFKFSSDQNNIALTFAGVDLTGHFLQLQYATDNDTLWIDLQGNILNTQLNSGNHQIKIRAVDVNNRISKSELKLSFTIATPFYKRWWFITLAALFFPAMLFWYLFDKRQTKLKVDFEKQLALERAGNRITADLHDDIGTTLSSININSNIAWQLIDKDITKTKEILSKLSFQTQTMLENLSEIIWSLKTGNDQFVNIESRIKNYVSDVLGSTNVGYEINIADNINQIKDVSLRKNALLIVKEAVNNAVKYSKATKIVIAMNIENQEVKIEVRDNGMGFNNGKSIGGNGLINMEKRAKELNGIIIIDSSPSKGTCIISRIPIAEFLS